jgi:UDP-2,4-diacetamido-2,4,6-trideoxy-beta-L-altropyranose hydrolase
LSASKEHRLVVFRADASPSIGGGHVMRCLSIARAFDHVGWHVAFASRSEFVRDLAALSGLQPEIVVHEDFDKAATLEAHFPSGCELLVTDHYGLDIKFERACRPWANRILVVGDYPGRQHDCDILLDPTLGRMHLEYEPFVPADCSVFVGPRYAPIRPEFVGVQSKSPSQGVGKVLVSMGATDPDNITGLVLGELAGLDLEIDIVLTSGAPHLSDVRSKNVGNLHVDVDAAQLACLMQAADLAIGASGSSAWERCAAGLPSLLFVIADNQTEVAHNLESAGAAKVLGRPEDVPKGEILEAIRAMNTNELIAMSMGALGLCDGRGAMRVATLVSKQKMQTGQNVTLRPVRPADCHFVYQWQIHPDIRLHAHQPTPPSESEHKSWFADRLADPEEQYFIIEHEGQPSGVLRLEPYARTDGDWLISILIAPECQRRGLGGATLDLAHALWPVSDFVAEVLPENSASHRLFASAGYTHEGSRYLRRGEAGTS